MVWIVSIALCPGMQSVKSSSGAILCRIAIICLAHTLHSLQNKIRAALFLDNAILISCKFFNYTELVRVLKKKEKMDRPLTFCNVHTVISDTTMASSLCVLSLSLFISLHLVPVYLFVVFHPQDLVSSSMAGRASVIIVIALVPRSSAKSR